MSYCKYCGKQLADGEKCSCEGAKKSGKNYKKLLIPAAVIITLVIGVMCVVSYVQSGLDLADYILIEGAEGFNGQGVLNYSIDSEALYMDMVDNSAWEKADEDNFEELLTNQISQNEEVDHALKSIELSATKEEGLSNGDKITVTAKFSNTLNYNFSHHFKDASVEYTVEGLPEGMAIDLFSEDNIKITFSGYDGQGEAEFELLTEDEVYEHIRYSLSANAELSNGDTVTLSAECDEYALEELGYFMPEQTEMTFTVEGLKEYFDISDGFPDKDLDKIIEHAMAAAQAEYEGDFIFAEGLTEPKLIGAYFVKANDPSVPYHDFINNLTMNNGVVVLYHYSLNVAGSIRNEWMLNIYPNCTLDDSGNITYDTGNIETYWLDAVNEEEVVINLTETFEEMRITQMR